MRRTTWEVYIYRVLGSWKEYVIVIFLPCLYFKCICIASWKAFSYNFHFFCIARLMTFFFLFYVFFFFLLLSDNRVSLASFPMERWCLLFIIMISLTIKDVIYLCLFFACSSRCFSKMILQKFYISVYFIIDYFPLWLLIYNALFLFFSPTNFFHLII